MAIKYKSNFKFVILSPNRIIYQNDIQSLFIKGDKGEYEILAYHYPLLGVLNKGNVIVNWNEEISLPGGVLKFYANECVILVEERKKPIEK